MNKPTVVLGASDNPERYSFRAVTQLKSHGHTVFPVGIKKGAVAGIQILNGEPPLSNIDTVSLYVGPDKQAGYLNYLLSLKPQRVIFNPGTENPEFEKALQKEGIETIEACTLVMLSIGNY